MFEALPQNCLFNLGAADLSALLYAGHEAAIHIEIVATCAKRVANQSAFRAGSVLKGWRGMPPGPLNPPLVSVAEVQHSDLWRGKMF